MRLENTGWGFWSLDRKRSFSILLLVVVWCAITGRSLLVRVRWALELYGLWFEVSFFFTEIWQAHHDQLATQRQTVSITSF